MIAAIPTTALGLPIGNVPDLELVHLGEQLNAIIREWHAKRTIDERHTAASVEPN